MGTVFLWSQLEPCLGIICACFPAVQPFLRFLLKVEYRAYIGSKFSSTSKHTDSSSGVAGFDERPDFMNGKHDDEMRLTIEAHAETKRNRQEREKLQQYIGPMFIRVQYDLELTVEDKEGGC